MMQLKKPKYEKKILNIQEKSIYVRKILHMQEKT